MKRLLILVLKRLGLEQLGVLIGYLRRSGWFRSLRAGRPLDVNGEALPWYSYPAIHLLEARLGPVASPINVFEFGSGNSTIWWARRAARVVSVEDSRAWYDIIAPQLPPNVQYLFAADEAAYLDALVTHPDYFDLVVVDGSHRPRCVEISIQRLSARGVLIVDNADWPEVDRAIAAMTAWGFRQLDLYGLAPGNGHPDTTAILYRQDNLLGL